MGQNQPCRLDQKLCGEYCCLQHLHTPLKLYKSLRGNPPLQSWVQAVIVTGALSFRRAIYTASLPKPLLLMLCSSKYDKNRISNFLLHGNYIQKGSTRIQEAMIKRSWKNFLVLFFFPEEMQRHWNLYWIWLYFKSQKNNCKSTYTNWQPKTALKICQSSRMMTMFLLHPI